MQESVRLDGVLTLVDAKHVGFHLDEVKIDDSVNEALQQIAYADRLVLNKTDLVPPSPPFPRSCDRSLMRACKRRVAAL